MKRGWAMFAAVTFGISAILFWVWSLVGAGYAEAVCSLAARFEGAAPGLPLESVVKTNWQFLIPTIAMMAGALGVGWRRKVYAIVFSLAGFLVFDILLFGTGLHRLVLGYSDFSNQLLRSLFTVGVFHTFKIVFPLALLVWFVGGKPERLSGRMVPGDGDR